jgi:sec-independent protein translocase protein TatB
MFDIGWSELLVIGVVAVVVVGPKELPRLMRTFGHYTGKIRAMASDFQRQFEEAVRETEIDEVRKAMQDFHAQASEAASPPVDKPLMTPKPVAPAPAAALAPAPAAAPAPAPKAKAKARRKPKPAANAMPANKTTAPKTASSKKPRARKREEGAS